MSGRKVPEYETDNIREIIENQYRIIYLIKLDKIDILAVIHCVKLLPESIWKITTYHYSGFQTEKDKIIIYRIRHRKEVYK